MTQLTFREWLKNNPVECDDEDVPCFHCEGKGYEKEETETGFELSGCEYCNQTGKQVVTDAYGVYLNHLIDDWKRWQAYQIDVKNAAKSPRSA